jgi:hypothetical protein
LTFGVVRPAADFDSFVLNARPFASSQIIGRTTLSPEILIVVEFEAALREALQNEESAVSGRMDWSKGFLADGRRFVLVTHEKDGRKRPTICSTHFVVIWKWRKLCDP